MFHSRDAAVEGASMSNNVRFPKIRNIRNKVVQMLSVTLAFLLLTFATQAQAQTFDWLVDIDDVVETINYDPTAAGQTVRANIAVTNDGPDPAPATTLSFIFEDEDVALAATEGTVTNCTATTFTGGLTTPPPPFTTTPPFDEGTIVTCDVPALGDQESAVVTVDLATTDATVIRLIAQVPVDPIEPNTINNRNSETITVIEAVDLDIEVTAPDVLAAGEVFDFDVDISNLGPNDAGSYRVTVPVPDGLVNIVPPMGCVAAGTDFICNISDDLVSGGVAPTLTFTAQIGVVGGSTIGITGFVDNSDPIDPVPENDTDVEVITVLPGTDAAITKTRTDIDGAPLLEGDLVTFTLGTSYTGNAPTGITVTDTLPGNYEILSVSTTGGYTCNEAPFGQLVECTNPGGGPADVDAPIGEIIIQAQVRPGAAADNVQNSATITSTGPDEQFIGNNTASDIEVDIQPRIIDPAAGKSGPRFGEAIVGSSYTYSIYQTVLGNDALTGTVILTDTLPAGVTLNSIGATNGYACTLTAGGAPATAPITVTAANQPVILRCEQTYTAANAVEPNLSTANSDRVFYNVTIDEVGDIDNTMVVSTANSNVANDNIANNTITYEVDASDAGESADVSAVKRAENVLTNPPNAVAGQPYTFQLEILNSGPATAERVRVRDTVRDLQDGTVAFTGVTYVGTSTNSCVENNASSTQRRLECVIAEVPVCVAGVDCPVISFTVVPGRDAETRTNTFEAFSLDTPDPAYGNNRDSIDYEFDRLVDMTVAKTAPDSSSVGVDLTYIVSAQNAANGLSTAAGVFITDILPPDVTFVSAEIAGGAACGTTPVSGTVSTGTTPNATNTIICTFPNPIPNGAQQAATIVVRPNFANLDEVIRNNVSVDVATAETDDTNNDNFADTVITDPSVDLLVNKSDDFDPLPLENEVRYTVSVTNSGPSASEQVVVTDTWPDSIISFQSVIPPAGGRCETVPAVDSFGQDVICQFDYLEVGESFEITYVGRGDARGAVVNNVEVSSVEVLAGFDRQEANNATEENTTVRPRTDIEVTSKTAVTAPVTDPATVNLREEFDFVVVVTVNDGDGLNEAEGVIFTDNLPPNMVLVGAPTFVLTTSGPADPARACSSVGVTGVTCTFGTLQVLDTVEITIPVRVDAVATDPATITNTASVSTTSLEDAGDRPNNTNSGDIVIGSSTIAGNVFVDFADNTDKEVTDIDLSGVPITLTGVAFDGTPIEPITINTDADGNFLFDFLPEGVYTLTRGDVADPYLEDGTVTEGNVDDVNTGTVAGNTITTIELPANNDSVDNIFRVIPQARIAIAKDASIDSLNIDGSVNVTFNMVVENFSLETVEAIEVTDQLAGGDPRFGTFVSLANAQTDPLAPGNYTIITAPSSTCGTANGGYNGSTDTVLSTGGSLRAGRTCDLSFTLRVTPTVAQLATGFENQAVVTGEGELSGQTSSGPDANPQLTDQSDDGVNPDADDNGQGNEVGENDPTPIPIAFEPSIALIKIADLSAISTPIILPTDVVTYRFTVRNTGNVTLTDIVVSDNVAGVVVAGTIASLAPGEVDSTSITATYSVLEADIIAGQITNTAIVTGTDPFDQDVTDVSGTDFDNDDPTVTTPLEQQPGVTIVKTAVTSGLNDPAQVGDTISYVFTIRNSGNVTLTGVTVTDDLDGLTLIGSPIATLLPGAVDDTSYSATYAIDFDDIEAGEVVNRASVTGQAPDGSFPEDESGLTPDTDEDTVVPLARVPAIETTKTQVLTDANGDGAEGVGDLVTYTITVQNTGNVPLTNVVVSDTFTDIDGAPLVLTTEPEFDSADQGSVEGELLQGETATYFATYILELEAVLAGGLRNIAIADAEGVSGDEGGSGTPTDVRDESDDGDDTDGNTDDDPTVLELAPSTDSSGLALSKTTPSEIVSRGDVVPYTITITNDATFTAGPFDIVDRLPNGLIYIPGSATLDGADADVTFTAGRVTWSGITIPALGVVEVTLSARVLTGVSSGSFMNTVSLIDPTTGDAVVRDDTATVRILPDTLFECTDVVGQVFNDVNGNGYQDAPETVGRAAITDQDFLGGKGKISPIAIEPSDETGIPSVRLATVDGTVITTDENGLFSVPCASLPASGGSNFILKVDERSLPAGYRMTTENPRVSRLTPGMMAEMNFGAAVALQVVRVDLTTASFVQTNDGVQMSRGLREGLRGVLQEIAGSPSNMVLSFFVPVTADADDVSIARDLLDLVEAQVKQDWRDVGRVRLRIEQAIVRAGQ